MEKVLYRKYRSMDFDQIVGQDHITSTLKNALSKNKISHAYLFTGPRGVGKTSIARILAHKINNLDYELGKTHVDIIEIDAASNRKIDEIRDLRDKVHILPSQAKFKVYIIDEVHMLTRDSFNALLKTLEEPPEHVVFILATTDAHKLPDTIISRTQRFTFKPISNEDIFNHLKEISKKEQIKVTDEALKIIAEHGDGSFRDSISILDQFSHFEEKIDVSKVLNLLGIPKKEQVQTLYDGLTKNHNFKTINDILEDLYNAGVEPTAIAKSLMTILRTKIIEDSLNIKSSDIELLDRLVKVEGSLDPSNYLLVSLLKANIQESPKSVNLKVSENVIEEKNETKIKKGIDNNTPKEDESEPTRNISKDLMKIWEEVLEELKKTHNTLYAILRMADISKDKNQINLVFDFPFHKNTISEAKNLTIIADLFKAKSGQNYKIQCILSGKDPKEIKLKEEVPIETITEIFGGGEVIEV